MSGRIDTPPAILAPPPARRAREEVARSRTIWLTDPIDLRQAVELLEIGDDPQERPNGFERNHEEIARRLRDPKRRDGGR